MEQIKGMEEINNKKRHLEIATLAKYYGQQYIEKLAHFQFECKKKSRT